jgi:chromosome segregation ATPase
VYIWQDTGASEERRFRLTQRENEILRAEASQHALVAEALHNAQQKLARAEHRLVDAQRAATVSEDCLALQEEWAAVLRMFARDIQDVLTPMQLARRVGDLQQQLVVAHGQLGTVTTQAKLLERAKESLTTALEATTARCAALEAAVAAATEARRVVDAKLVFLQQVSRWCVCFVVFFVRLFVCFSPIFK